jgi:hypothetical protein
MRTRTRRGREARRRLPAAILALAAVWLVGQAAPLRAAPAIPGPIGGPEIAQDVNTMLGKKGPGFTLRDGDGKAYKIAPGGTGRPLVVISHMGFY